MERFRQDGSRSRDQKHYQNNVIQRVQKSTDQDRNSPKIPNVIDIYNIPEHFNKQDISYYIFKNLQTAKGLKKSLNPISRSEYIQEKKCIRLQFKSRDEALNCLQLNGLYYGNKAFYMKSQLLPRLHANLQLKSHQNIRRVNPIVEEGFHKIYIGNLPPMPQYELIDWLSSIGQLKAFEQISGNDQSQCFCQFKNKEQTQQFVAKMNTLKIKGRSVIAKRAALMKSSQTTKSKIQKSSKRSTMFQQDESSYYLTLDIDGFFKTMKISCVLLLKNLISIPQLRDQILKDVEKQVSKIGGLIKIKDKGKNIYLEYERVEYAQIAYLVISSRKYDQKAIQVSFYDPINFADQILI